MSDWALDCPVSSLKLFLVISFSLMGGVCVCVYMCTYLLYSSAHPYLGGQQVGSEYRMCFQRWTLRMVWAGCIWPREWLNSCFFDAGSTKRMLSWRLALVSRHTLWRLFSEKADDTTGKCKWLNADMA